MDSPNAATPLTLSPFSNHSVGVSEATSEELPDLGAFNTVFRALGRFQVARPVPLRVPTDDDIDTDVFRETFDDDQDDDSGTGSAFLDEENEEPEDEDYDEQQQEQEEGYASGSDSPSIPIPLRRHKPYHHYLVVEDDIDIHLGSALDEALSFIAAERLRFASTSTLTQSRPTGSYSPSTTTSDSPRRKRRRKRRPIAVDQFNPKSTDAHSDDDQEHNVLRHSKSVPSLRHRVSDSIDAFGDVSASNEEESPTKPFRKPQHEDADVTQLKSLAVKLRIDFPADVSCIDSVMLRDSNKLGWFDTRGPEPGPNDPPIHVFVDHSNILIGLLNQLKNQKRNGFKFPNNKKPVRPALTRKPSPLTHLSHASLALILERGRPITRRALVTSSPLYQPVDSAARLGYDVKVYVRVPDLGDGPDRAKRNSFRRSGSGSFKHRRKTSNTSVDTSSGSGENTTTHNTHSDSVLPVFSKQQRNAESSSHAHTTPSSPTQARIKYREQGVDELIQLKLLQAIAASDLPAVPGSTIVLATGDGNIGQFNEEGFLGCVRTALRRGWNVELYAWEEGLSRAWRREFGGKSQGGNFKIIGLEKYWEELVALVPICV